jgi:pimeloyl-ACP methyl ester carboxylesterase
MCGVSLKKAVKITGIGLAGLLGLLAMALALSSIYQMVASERAVSHYPPPGKMVEVGGYRLHFDCVGSGEPTIILEAGGGLFSLGWVFVQPALAQATSARVCSYDRAGLGWSDENPGPYSMAGEVEALHRGLTVLGVKGRLVLVGHSYGGFMARLYASRFPQDVIGLVLIDPNTTTFFERHPCVLEEVHTQSRLLRIAAPLGLARWFAVAEFRDSMRLPKDEDVVKMFELSLATKHLRSVAKMLGEFSNTVAAMQVLDAQIDIPMTIVSRGKADQHFPWGDPEREADWRAGHEQWVRNAEHGRLIIADKSDHMIIFDQPELIVESVKEMLSHAEGRK